jgi:hypothetical protein
MRKMKISLISDLVRAETIELSIEELSTFITTRDYSPFIFSSKHRRKEDFLSTELLVLDYDNAPTDTFMSLDDACNVFAPYKHIIAPTHHHGKPKKNMPAADRFRVVLFLEHPITDADTYAATWRKVADQFPGCDESAKDTARLYYKSTHVHSFHINGITVPIATPAKKTKTTSSTDTKRALNPRTARFLANGAPSGKWHDELVQAAFDMHQNGYSEEDALSKLESATGDLDTHHDLPVIHSIFRSRPKYEPNEPLHMPKVQAWVGAWLKEHSATLSYRTDIVTLDGEAVGADEVLRLMRLAAKHYAENTTYLSDKGEEKNVAPFDKGLIEDAYRRWENETRKEQLNIHRNHVDYRPGKRDEIERWVEAVTGERNPHDIAVMTHFIWQVKRKLHGMPVEWHIMPILFGPTGSGKTEAVRALLAPIRELTDCPQDMQVLGDSREGFIFAKYYVVFFDELARADRVDVSALKNKITCDTISYRVLGTNTKVTNPNVATFIGASNHFVDTIIQDPTSARRFWQIETQARVDWHTVNTLDYVGMWQSVSHEEAAPILPHIDEIRNIQETELRSKGVVEQWLESVGAVWGEKAADAPGLMSNGLYQDFILWCEGQRMRSVPTQTAFGRELSRLGIVKKRLNKCNVYLVKLNSGGLVEG